MNLRIGAAAAALLFSSLLPAQAGARDDLLKAMDQCAGVADEHQRLTCYDQLAPQVKAALTQTPMAGPPTVEEQKSWFGFDFGGIFGSAPKQQTTPQQFGSESLPPPPAPPAAPGAPPPVEPIDSIAAKVTDYAFNPFGKFVVFLDNGQVWRQLQGDSEIATFSKHGTNSVTITRGLIGSYNLQIDGSDRIYKVKRVK